jgi:tetratricopeptide (TPR) repeat protein
VFPIQIRLQSIQILFACAVTALGGCSWYGFGDTKKDEMTQELTERARRSEEAGDLSQATDSLSRVAQIDTADVAARIELARLHREAGRIDEAILSLREVVALTPDDSRAWLELGQLYYQKENDVTANACLDAALQLDPHLITALMIRGEIEERRQQETRALEFYHRVLSLEENYPPALLKIARIQMRHNESVRASVLLRSVCYCRGATPGQIAEARWLLGLSYGQQLRWDDAIESMSIAIEIMEQPGADDLYYLAYAQYQSEQHLEVEQTLDRLLALQPNHGPARSLKQAAVREEKRLLGEIQQASGIEPIPPPPPLGWTRIQGKARVADR